MSTLSSAIHSEEKWRPGPAPARPGPTPAWGRTGPVPTLLLTGLVTLKIERPLPWWRAHLPDGLRRFLGGLWPWPLVAYFLLSFFDLWLAIWGNNPALVNALPPWVFGLLFLAILTALARDLQPRPRRDQVPVRE